MLAKGIGFRQFATRIALYCDANEARSADEVPGIPLASDAPGAPAVDPPIADGHAGGVGVGVGVGTVNDAGVVVYTRPETLAAADAAETVLTGAAAEAPEVVEEVDPVAAFVEPVAAALALPATSSESAAAEAVDAVDAVDEATMSALLRDGATVTAGAAPWIKMTVAITAVARNTAFFNVCTPIQRLHCPPI